MELEKLDDVGTFKIKDIFMFCPDCKNKMMILSKTQEPFVISLATVIIPTQCIKCGYGGSLEIDL